MKIKDNEKYINIAKTCFTVIMAFGAVKTVAFLSGYAESRMDRMSFIYLLSFSAFCAGIWKLLKAEKRRLLFSVLFGQLFSCGIVFGSLIQTRHSVFMGPESKLMLLLHVVCLGVPMASIFDILCDLLVRCKSAGAIKLSNRKFALIVFIIIFAAWIPVWLAFYPCIYGYDAPMQRHVYAHMGLWSSQQPLIHSLLFNGCWELGLLIDGTAETGMAIYTVIQMTALDGAITYALTWLHEKRSRGIWLMVLWFAFFPVHPILAISVTKDTLFAALVLVLVVYQFRSAEKELNWKSLIGIAFLMSVMLMFRGNAIYALAVAAVVTLFLMKKNRKYYVAVVFISICIAKAGEAVMGAAVNAEPAPTVEKFCLLFQQMARVGQEADLEAVSDYISEEATQVYTETFADPVKWTSSEDMFDDFGAFIKTWAEVGLEYPSLYLDAAIANTAGYWYIDDYMIALLYYLQLDNLSFGDEMCDIERTVICQNVNERMYKLFKENEYQQDPVLSVLCSVALYTWILIFYVLYMIYRKRYQLLIPTMFLIAYLLTLFMGPCVLVRYAYLMMLAAPVLVAILMEEGRKEKYTEERIK